MKIEDFDDMYLWGSIVELNGAFYYSYYTDVIESYALDDLKNSFEEDMGVIKDRFPDFEYAFAGIEKQTAYCTIIKI